MKDPVAPNRIETGVALAPVTRSGEPWSWWLAGVAIVLLMCCAGAVVRDTPSMWRHLSSGRHIFHSGLPELDVLTALGANRRWVNPSWLFDLALYGVQLGGDWALASARFLFITLIGFSLIRPPSASRISTRVLPVLVAIPALHEAFRLVPMLPALLILERFVAKLVDWERRRSISMVAWLFAIQVLWSNVSSTFILGPICIALRWLGSRIDDWVGTSPPMTRTPDGRYLIALVTSVAGCCVTPYGAAVFRAAWLDCFAAFVVPADGQSLVPGLAALWSTSWVRPASVAFFILLATTIIGEFVTGIRFRELMVTLFFSGLAIVDFRLVPLAAIWLVLVTERALDGLAVPTMLCGTFQCTSVKSFWAIRMASLMAAAWVVFLFLGPVRESLRDRVILRGATARMQSRLRWLAENAISGIALPLDPSDGGWLEWSNQKLRPVLDDRCELFADYYSIYRRVSLDLIQDRHNSYRRSDGSVGGWRQMSNALPFDWIVSRAGDIETNMALSSSIYWAPVYWDADVMLFGRKYHELAQTTARRLANLRRETPTDIELGTGFWLHDTRKSRQYSRHEFVELAKVYAALECPQIADFIIDGLNDPRLVAQRTLWPDRSMGTVQRRAEYELASPGEIEHQ